MRIAIHWLAGAIVGLHCNDLWAAERPPDAEQAFETGSRSFASGDYASALERFLHARAAGMQTAAVAYNIGVCQYRLGDYAESEKTFRRMATDYPDWYHLAQYNAGLALVRQDRLEDAGDAFAAARGSSDTAIAALADAMLLRITERGPAIESAPRPPGRSVFLELGIGYDDNLVLLDESNVSTGVTTDSGFVELFGQLGGTPGFAGNFHYDASAYLVHYPDANRFDQAVLRFGGAWSWQVSDWRAAAGPYYSASTLDADGYDQRLGLSVSIGRPLTTYSRVAMQLAWEEIDELSSRFAFIGGNRKVLGLRYLRQQGPHRLNLRYEYSIDDRSGASVSPVRHSIRGTYDLRLDDKWSAGVEVALRNSEYDELQEPRDEDLAEIAVLVARDLSPRWQLTAEYRYADNDSNVDVYAYQRHRATLSANRIF